MRLILSFAVLFFSVSTFGQFPLLEKEVKNILSSDAFEYGTVGMNVRSLDGKSVLSLGDHRLIPASSLKLITNFLALKELGASYQFKTKIGYSGTILSDGTLTGDVVIIGSGDPTLGSSRFGEQHNWQNTLEKITRLITKAGITCIDGNIEIRTNVFEGQSMVKSWPYGDIANYYGSGAWAINYNENKYNLFFEPTSKVGQLAKIQSISPYIPSLTVSSEVVTGAKNSGDNAYVYGDPFHFQKVVRGSIPVSSKAFKIKGAIPNPPYSFGQTIAIELAKMGITSQSVILVENPIKKSAFRELGMILSPSLENIIFEGNYESINLISEALYRLIAKKKSNRGSIDSAAKVIGQLLVDMGIPKSSFHIEDGSGLSPRNLITPSAFTQYLTAIDDDLGLDALLSVLPVAGESGTVKTLLRNKKFASRFRLKSGSMGGVLSYTGYFQAKSDTWYAVSFIANNHAYGNYKVKTQVDKILSQLYNQL